MTINREKKLLSLEVVQLVAAIGLFVSPWAFGFTDVEAAAWSAWITAGFMVVLASLTSIDEPEWAGWGTLLAGLWALVGPVVLGVTATVAAVWSHAVAGGVVTIAAIAVLWLTGRAARTA
jgi:hypothetical protein